MFDRVRGLGVAVVSETVVSRGWGLGGGEDGPVTNRWTGRRERGRGDPERGLSMIKKQREGTTEEEATATALRDDDSSSVCAAVLHLSVSLRSHRRQRRE